MPVVLGVDSSTQSTKVEARDLATGEVLASASAKHLLSPPPYSEQDPDAWYSALRSAIHALGSLRAEIAAISVAGQQHGLVLLGEDGVALGPAQLWNDTRGAANAERLVANIGESAWLAGCGSVPVPSFTISKLAWVAEHQPELLERVHKVMLPHDYLTWRLCGKHVTDRGDASGTGWFDARRNEYRTELLGLVVQDPADWIGRLPTVVDHRVPAGELTDETAQDLGLVAGIPVGSGTGDNMAAAVGLGLQTGDLAISLGTSGTVYSVSDVAPSDETGHVAGFAGGAGGFLPLVCTLNATRVTDTVAAWLGTDAPGLSDLALQAGIGPIGPELVPYFDGERTPNLPDATGSMTGLTTATTRAQIARAAHDGVLGGLMAGVDALIAAGIACDGQVHLIGGGSRAAAYQQRCAELLGKPIVVPSTDETVATGAAVLAAGLLEDSGSADRAQSWSLGAGETVVPRS